VLAKTPNFNKWCDAFERFVRAHKQLTTTHKLVVLALVPYLNRRRFEATIDTSIWPSHETLAKETGLSRHTAIKALKQAARQGIIESKHRFSRGMKTSNMYTLRTAKKPNKIRCSNPATSDVASRRSAFGAFGKTKERVPHSTA
jgi:hypothetical protein